MGSKKRGGPKERTSEEGIAKQRMGRLEDASKH
jgi:hypothetical protein